MLMVMKVRLFTEKLLDQPPSVGFNTLWCEWVQAAVFLHTQAYAIYGYEFNVIVVECIHALPLTYSPNSAKPVRRAQASQLVD